VHYTDSELLELIRNDDRKAFNEIYNRYWLKLYKTACRKINSTDEAEDMVQDVFFGLWKKRKTLAIQHSLAAYFGAAIQYKIINHIAANIVKRRYIQSLNQAEIDYDNLTCETINFNDTEKLMNLGLNKLPPQVRKVFELSRKENVSINEIALKFEVSHQTVKNQISKAIKILKVHLNNSSVSIAILVPLLF
jgi:RNA polymerase sigma-70 factor (family 1)